jgi:colicin import membrane protein
VSDIRDDKVYRPLGLSLGLHITLAVVLAVGWVFHSENDTVRPPAMMKAALVSAPKSTLAPQRKTQTQKQEKPKPEEAKPEPPKPAVEKPKEVKPEIVPTDKPSPIAAKPEKPAPPKPQETTKQPDKKPEPPKRDAIQTEKAQKALSQKQTKKISKDAEMELEALLNDEEVTRQGDLSDDENGKWAGLISARIEENWSRPPNARKDMKVVMEIELLPDGTVVSVRIVESSGDRAFDMAAETAVRKAERFEEIATMKPALFASTFRKFKLLFNPEDLLN